MSAGKKKSYAFFHHFLKFICPNARIIIQEKGGKKKKQKHLKYMECLVYMNGIRE